MSRRLQRKAPRSDGSGPYRDCQCGRRILGVGVSGGGRPTQRACDPHGMVPRGIRPLVDPSRAYWARYPADVFGEGPSGGGGAECFPGRATIGYDHGYDGEVFYLGLALDPAYVEGFVERCLKRMGEDNAEEERLFRNLWEDETQRGVVIESLKADCEVRTGRPSG